MLRQRDDLGQKKIPEAKRAGVWPESSYLDSCYLMLQNTISIAAVLSLINGANINSRLKEFIDIAVETSQPIYLLEVQDLSWY